MLLSDFVNNLEKCAEFMPQILADAYTGGLQVLDTEMQRRIFEENVDTFGNSLGQYSNKAAYFTKKQFNNKGAFKPIGKGEDIVGAKQSKTRLYNINSHKGKDTPTTNGRVRKSMFLRNGYKELRAIQGYPVDAVKLQYSGQLRNNGIVQRIAGDRFRLVFANKLAQDKARGFEEHHGKIVFTPSVDEKQKATQYIGDYIIHEMENRLKVG